MAAKRTPSGKSKLDQIVAQTQQSREQRERGYREQALKMYPWICGRCAREFTRENLHELTVHHRDHDHDNNPANGSNWELLCLYCHDNEHAKYLDSDGGGLTGTDKQQTQSSTHKPFSNLKDLLKKG